MAMKFPFYIISVVILLGCSHKLSADESDTQNIAANDVPRHLVFSHLQHPQAEDLIQILTGIYREIGIETTFNGARANDGLIMLKKRIVDGDLARPKFVIDDFEHLLTVKPALFTASINLLCSPNIQCDESQLHNKDNLVLTNLPVAIVTEKLGYSANFTSYSEFDKDLELLRNRRTDYVLFAGPIEIMNTHFAEASVVNVSSFPMYHVLDRRHIAILEKVEAGLTHYFENN